MTISEMGVLRLWEIPNPKQPNFTKAADIQTGIRSPTAIDYYESGESRWAIVGNENNDISIIDMDKKVEENVKEKHGETVLSIKLHNNHMLTASENGEIYTWNFEDEKILSEFENDFRNECISYKCFTSEVAIAGKRYDKYGQITNKIAVWKVGDEKAEDYLTSKNSIIDIVQNRSDIIFIEKDKLTIGSDETALNNVATTLATIFDSKEAFVGFEDGNIVKYPSKDAFEKVNSSEVRKIKITRGKLIAGFGDGSIEIFDLTGNHMKTLKGHEKAITNIDIYGYRLISISEDGTLKVWDIESGKCAYTYFLDIYATAINSMGNKLVIGDTLGNITFLEFENF
jgi:WD40 repeat protein